MADSYIQVPPDSTGKKVDTDQLTIGANDVQRQRFQIAGTADVDIAPVSATNGLAVDAKTLAPDAATETTLSELAAQSLDYDTGAGSAPTVVLGLALPASGGPVAGGTSTNPIQVSLANTGANATAVKVDGSAVTQPVSGTVAATQSGSWVLSAGSAIIGKVSIDQTTPGTTNGVQINAALPAGNNNIGDVDVASIVPGTGATNLGKAEDAAHTTGDVGVMSLGVANEAQGTFGADADYTPIATDTKGNTLIAGNIANDGVDAGNPVKVGMKALAHGANPSAVAAADRTNWYANRAGIPWVIGGHPNIVTLEAEYTAAQTNTAIVTVSTGTIIVVTQIQATVDEATTVGVGLRVGFATATTPTTTGVVVTHPGMVPGSGISRGDGSGILGIGADNEDLRITSEVPTGGALRILVSYYTIES